MKANSNYCTLFDIHFLPQGLVMYKSLARQCEHFHLYIFAFCDVSLQLLRTLNQLEHVASTVGHVPLQFSGIVLLN